MLIVYKKLQKYKLYQTNTWFNMNRTLKFTQFLTDIKKANPLLVESVIEAYHAIYESSEELVDEINNDFDKLGGSVPESELTGVQKVPMHKQEEKPQSDDLATQYMNFKRYGSDKIPMRKSDRSPMVDFIEYELDDKDLADELEVVLMKSVEGRPTVHKEVTEAFEKFISEQIDIDQFADVVDKTYEQIEAIPEEEDDYTASLENPDVIGGVLDTSTGNPDDEEEDEDIANFFKSTAN